MFQKRVLTIIFFSAILLLVVSCSKYQKLLKSSNVDAKYNAAFGYYDKGDYFKAIQMLDGLITYVRGTDKAEKVYYAYAYSNYYEGDYILAGYHFKNFVNTFPKSDKAEECAYMSAYCEYMNSPDYYLDQSNTMNAIQSFQLFVNEYPKSKYVEECNKYIDELRAKLEEKSFETGELYYKTQEYKAAIVAFNNTLKDYPNTKHKEEILFYILKANYTYGSKSIDAKKKERLEATLNAYNVLITNFPKSKYLREAEMINVSASRELNKHKT